MMRLIDADALDAAFTGLRFSADRTLAHWGDRPDWCLHGSEVEKLIENAPTVGGWISVKTKLPGKLQNVLVSLVNEIDGHRLKEPQIGYHTEPSQLLRPPIHLIRRLITHRQPLHAEHERRWTHETN